MRERESDTTALSPCSCREGPSPRGAEKPLHVIFETVQQLVFAENGWHRGNDAVRKEAIETQRRLPGGLCDEADLTRIACDVVVCEGTMGVRTGVWVCLC